ncbi:MAG: hypothetical protein OER12_06085 [Acidimicrobiia bacterium]|nr:hypothetical protein [Acidimicrobiia bacterium]
MRWKLTLVVVAGAIALSGCSRLDALHVDNPCDFPVTVLASGPAELAMKTLRPGSESVVLEGIWQPDHPVPLSIRTVEITYGAEVDMSTLPDVRVSIPLAACQRSRIDIPSIALIDIGWNGRASTVKVTGTTEMVDAFAGAAASVVDAVTSVDRPTGQAAELTVWPDDEGTEIVESLLGPLFELEYIEVSVCQGGSACKRANVVGDDSIVPSITLPAAERPDPWAAPIGLALLAGGSVAIWAWVRRRRKATEIDLQTGT